MTRAQPKRKAKAKSKPKSPPTARAAKAGYVGFVRPEKPTKSRPKPSARPKPAGALLENRELEAVIAGDPYDDHAWSVLEDWLLERGDPRAAIVVAERAGEAPAAEAARKPILKLLLPGDTRVLADRVRFLSEWRAGFLRKLTFCPPRKTTDEREIALFGALIATPAARLVRDLSVGKYGDDIIPLIARAPCVRSLRVLELGGYTEAFPYSYDVGALAAVPLVELVLTYACPRRYTKSLARLRKLWMHPRDGRLLHGLFPDAGYPALRELYLMPQTLAGHDVPAALAELFAGRATPALERLAMYDADDHIHALLPALANSPLVAQLRELCLGHRPGSYVSGLGAELEAERVIPGRDLGDAFAHLERVTVPKYFEVERVA